MTEAEIRRFVEIQSGNNARPLRMTFAESLAAAQVEPEKLELTRAGKRFALGNSAAITGIANVTALPTTAAQWVLYNFDEAKTFFFETLGVYLTSGTPGVGGVLLAALVRLPVVAAPETQYTGVKVSSLSSPGVTSKLSVKASITVSDPAAPNWFPIAFNNNSNVGAFPGSATIENREIKGGIALRPGYGLALNVLGLAGTTPLFAPFAEWIELDTDMQ